MGAKTESVHRRKLTLLRMAKGLPSVPQKPQAGVSSLELEEEELSWGRR
jgi:hypothetical protein